MSMSVATNYARLYPRRPKKVYFDSDGFKLVGHLFIPSTYRREKLPGIVILTPGGGVKEQVVSNYARELCVSGFVTMVFDHRSYGESEGQPRNFEHSGNKIHDAGNALSFLRTCPEVDATRIGGLGICAGSAYILTLAMQDKRLKSVATVSAILDHGKFLDTLGGDKIGEFLVASNEAREQYYLTGEELTAPLIAPDVDEDSDPFFKECFDYYRTNRAGSKKFPTYNHQMFLGGFQEILLFNILPQVSKLAETPFLGIVGELAETRPDTERFYTRCSGPKELFVVKKATHFSLYDKREDVSRAARRLSSFFNKTLR